MYSDLVHDDLREDEDIAQSTAMIEAEVDAVKWKTELERVSSKLKVHVSPL